MRCKTILGGVLGLALAVMLVVNPASAEIIGLTGTTFDLAAKEGYISAPNGAQLYTWGYGPQGGLMQYPGPTLIVNQGDEVTVNLINELPERAGNVSMIFPGHQVDASGGVAGTLTQEAPPDGATEVTYTFTATNPGTYVYFSGTNPDLHVEMGLAGTLIVRSGTAGQAYNHADTAYDYEYLFFLSEMDPNIHSLVEAGKMDEVDAQCPFPTTGSSTADAPRTP